MLEIGIPVYKARATLPKALDSLVAQTKSMFIVCLSIDGDKENYSDIIKTYKERGLKIRVINSKINGGPGTARQRILDTTQCDYIMFMDADDMLMPRAAEILYQNIKFHNYDIMRSSFIRESKNGPDKYLAQNVPSITWFHGKIYSVKYLKEKNIRFLDGLRIDEDAYFNVIAWNSTQNRGEITEPLYIWRDNPNSITRKINEVDYFKKNCIHYFRSQVEGMKKLFEINGEIKDMLVAQTLMNLYYYYMKANFYKVPLNDINIILSSLREEKWMKQFLNNGENWLYIVQNLKVGTKFDNTIVFYEETFNRWAGRLLRSN